MEILFTQWDSEGNPTTSIILAESKEVQQEKMMVEVVEDGQGGKMVLEDYQGVVKTGEPANLVSLDLSVQAEVPPIIKRKRGRPTREEAAKAKWEETIIKAKKAYT